MRAQCTAIATLAVLLLSGSSQRAVVEPASPGIPRLPDGKPNLSAPVTRTADGHPELWGSGAPGPSDYYMDLTGVSSREKCS